MKHFSFKKSFAALAIAVGMLSSLHPSLGQEHPIRNGGFEVGLTPWRVATPLLDRITPYSVDTRTGNASLKIIGGADSPLTAQRVDGIQAGGYYRFSAWVKVLQTSPTDEAEAGVKIENYNIQNQNTRGRYGRQKFKKDGQWHLLSVDLQANLDTVRTELMLRVFGEGTVLFDDVKLELVAVNNQPQAVQTNTPQKTELAVSLPPTWTSPELPRIKAVIQTLAGQEMAEAITQVKRSSTNQLFSVAYEIPALAEGDYKVTFHYQENQAWEPVLASKPNYIFTVSPKRKPHYLTDNGVILHNGKPFFPIGMYHPGSTEADYKALAENGFNAIQGSPTLDLQAFEASLNLAQQYGLAVDVPLYGNTKVAENREISLEKVRRFAKHPAIFTWKILDEPDLYPAIMHEVPGLYRDLKAADPDRPIELTMALDDGLKFWNNFSDIVQIDRYPVPGRPLTIVSDFSRLAMSHMQPWQNLTFVVQCGWTPDRATQPTVAQARSMVYLALASGAKGIFWYSMFDPGWDLKKTPLWRDMKGINEEVKALSEPIMLGVDDKSIRSSNEKVHFIAKKHGGKLYLLVTNPENDGQTVSFNFAPKLQLSNGHILGSGQEVEAIKQQLTLQLSAIDSQTLVFDYQENG